RTMAASPQEGLSLPTGHALQKGLGATLACLLGWVSTASAVLPYGAQPEDQSAFALGSITWNVIYVESDGSIDANQENWTAGQLAVMQSEVLQAADYWESLTADFHPSARLSVNVNFVNDG